MSDPISTKEVSRREALAILSAAGMGLAMTGLNLHAKETKPDALEEALKNFSGASQDQLRRLLHDPKFSGRISAEDAAALAHNENATVEKLMVDLLPVAKTYSRAPISEFHVGVVVKGASGNLYTGANIEIPGQCLGFAVHGEQSALSNAYMHGEKGVTALAVNGAPCGHCRQFINEMSPDGEILIMAPNQSPTKLSALLPAAFGPAALGKKDGALPVRETNLVLTKPSSDPLTGAGLDAARKSYAPYSNSPAGIAIRASGEKIFRGSYIENVAYNPSLSPLQTALAALIAAGEPYSAITAVTLVEVHGAKISQKAVTETVLSAIAPIVKLEVIAAKAYAKA
jgi:cytidine deaminase